MELQAALQSIHIYSPDPLAAAHLYGSIYGMELRPIAHGYRCIGPGRELKLSSGQANQLKYVYLALQCTAQPQRLGSRPQPTRAPAKTQDCRL